MRQDHKSSALMITLCTIVVVVMFWFSLSIPGVKSALTDIFGSVTGLFGSNDAKFEDTCLSRMGGKVNGKECILGDVNNTAYLLVFSCKGYTFQFYHNETIENLNFPKEIEDNCLIIDVKR